MVPEILFGAEKLLPPPLTKWYISLTDRPDLNCVRFLPEFSAPDSLFANSSHILSSIFTITMAPIPSWSLEGKVALVTGSGKFRPL